jgi:hypothetical protein
MVGMARRRVNDHVLPVVQGGQICWMSIPEYLCLRPDDERSFRSRALCGARRGPLVVVMHADRDGRCGLSLFVAIAMVLHFHHQSANRVRLLGLTLTGTSLGLQTGQGAIARVAAEYHADSHNRRDDGAHQEHANLLSLRPKGPSLSGLLGGIGIEPAARAEVSQKSTRVFVAAL